MALDAPEDGGALLRPKGAEEAEKVVFFVVCSKFFCVFVVFPKLFRGFLCFVFCFFLKKTLEISDVFLFFVCVLCFVFF